MSIDLGNVGRGVFYVNFNKTYQGAGEDNSCKTSREFNFGNLVEKSSDYMIAVERMYVPIHSIPMQAAQADAVTIENPITHELRLIATPDVYSLKEMIDSLNSSFNDEFPDAGPYIQIHSTGYVSIYWPEVATYTVTFNSVLQGIFGYDGSLGALNIASAPYYGNYSIFDRFDQLFKIQLEIVGVNSVAEIIDSQRSLPVLTDYLIPETWGASISKPSVANRTTEISEGITFSQRQALVYNATGERRYVMLTGNTPIQNITIEAVAIYKDGTRVTIPIIYNSVFDVKIGFYKRQRIESILSKVNV